MGTHFIQNVTPVRGAIDRLDWEVRIATDFHGGRNNQAFATHWNGDVVFFREAVASNLAQGPDAAALRLAARWTNQDRSARMFVPSEVTFQFTTDLPGDALERIERYRHGGRLHARLDGKLYLFHRTPSSTEVPERLGPWLDDIVKGLENTNYSLHADIRSESKELTRDPWCTEILGVLRPPGRVVLEALLPIGAATEAHGARAVEHLEGAQTAFDEGRYDEAARLAYKAGEALQQLGRGVEDRYGELAQKSIAKQTAALQYLCHPERHDASKVVGGHETDRVMALHVITSLKSLAAVYLAGPRKG